MLPARSPDRPATASAASPVLPHPRTEPLVKPFSTQTEKRQQEKWAVLLNTAQTGCSVSSQLGMPAEVFMPPHRKNNYDIVTKLSNITRNLVLPGV